MNKVLLIIRREYLSRVKKKSFLLLTFLVPLLIIGMYALIFALSVKGGDTLTVVSVLDESGLFEDKLKDTRTVVFQEIDLDIKQAKKEVQKDDEYFLLYIPSSIGNEINPELYSQKKTGLAVQGDIENQMKEVMRAKMLNDAGIDINTLAKIKPEVNIITKELTVEGEKDSNAGAAYGIGIACAILIYMSLFIYGAQVMRGVIEEKTSRIVEVIISSVRPFQLMMGKIIGIGLVGLTQFLLWVILSAGLMTLSTNFLMKEEIQKQQTGQTLQGNVSVDTMPANNSPSMGVIKAIQTINFGYILTLFFVYFLGGYLLYSALFAAVGSAVDSETETQQFMFPMTLPLLFTYIMSFSFIINNPDSSLSFWLSIIPLTSPIAMLVRIPFGVPVWELVLSISLLIAGFIFTTWVAARVYRVGILMYGKRASYKELIKWFNYKE